MSRTVIPPRESHCVITGGDTVAVAGEHGRWIVGAVRPVRPFAHRVEDRDPAVLVTRVEGGRSITATSMWVHPLTLTRTRKGNAQNDVLAEVYDIHEKPIRYGIASSICGAAENYVYDFGA